MSRSRRYLSRPKVRKRYGISNMTLWRWEHDPRLDFPKPLKINGRLYQDESALEEWERKRAIAAADYEAAQ